MQELKELLIVLSCVSLTYKWLNTKYITYKTSMKTYLNSFKYMKRMNICWIMIVVITNLILNMKNNFYTNKNQHFKDRGKNRKKY